MKFNFMYIVLATKSSMFHRHIYSKWRTRDCKCYMNSMEEVGLICCHDLDAAYYTRCYERNLQFDTAGSAVDRPVFQRFYRERFSRHQHQNDDRQKVVNIYGKGLPLAAKPVQFLDSLIYEHSHDYSVRWLRFYCIKVGLSVDFTQHVPKCLSFFYKKIN
jgi:hypothetical protein